MPRRPARHPRLADRDYEIFEHLTRYRVTVREVLHKLFFDDSEPNAATKVTSRLVQHGFLNRYELYGPRSYFVIGMEGARILGLSQKKTKPLGPQALTQEFGTLAYCWLGTEERERLLVREVQAKFPHLLAGKLDSSHYYLDRDGEQTRLGYIRVDQGGTPDHVVRKCRDDLQERERIPAWKAAIEGDRFLIAVATTHQDKAAAIRESLRRHTWPIRFRIEVIPDLIQLIGRGRSV
jgi:hypothetical protein